MCHSSRVKHPRLGLSMSQSNELVEKYNRVLSRVYPFEDLDALIVGAWTVSDGGSAIDIENEVEKIVGESPYLEYVDTIVAPNNLVVVFATHQLGRPFPFRSPSGSLVGWGSSLRDAVDEFHLDTIEDDLNAMNLKIQEGIKQWITC